jgi:hypothetical protein
MSTKLNNIKLIFVLTGIKKTQLLRVRFAECMLKEDQKQAQSIFFFIISHPEEKLKKNSFGISFFHFIQEENRNTRGLFDTPWNNKK